MFDGAKLIIAAAHKDKTLVQSGGRNRKRYQQWEHRWKELRGTRHPSKRGTSGRRRRQI